MTHAGKALADNKSVLEKMGPTRKFLGYVSSFSDVIGNVNEITSQCLVCTENISQQLHPAARAAMVAFDKMQEVSLLALDLNML